MRRAVSPLAWRLTAAFVVVAVTALGVLVVLLLAATRSEIGRLASAQQRQDAAAAAAAAADAYSAAGSWDGADLTAAAAVAARGQATLIVTDAQGVLVAAATDQAARMMAEMHGVDVVDVPRADPVAAPVIVDGARVGIVHLSFPSQGLSASVRQVRDSLSGAALLGGLFAALLAVAVALFVARRVTAPIAAMTEAATRLAGGQRDARVALPDAPGELGQLSRAFDRMADAVQREDELRRRLVADVAHEVRTPLTILRGMTEGLVDGVIAADGQTLASLHEEVLRLTTLVADLETLAAADAAGLTLDQQPLDLADVARAATDLAQRAAADADLTLQTDLQPAPTVGDARRLAQVVTNLLANAIRYTPAGGAVEVRTLLTAGHAVVEVRDTGPGIPHDELTRVFERFFRGRGAGSAPGSGIGLAVAHELTAAQGGLIEVANDPRGGAVFTVRLPGRVARPSSA